MRKIREVLRLKLALKLSDRQIAKSAKLSRSTINGYIGRAEAAGLSWPLPEDLDDEALETKLYPKSVGVDYSSRSIPDWEDIHKERKRKGLTLFLLWQEYKLEHINGLAYSSYTLKYRQWCKERNLSMRQYHKAGEKLFVDYAGMTIDITDPATGEIKEAQVFVATLGASNYTFAEATWTQTIEDWLASHRKTLEFLGGVPEIIVPDNLKTGVKSPSYYEPDINRSYLEFAEHYSVAIIPARVRKPKDKAKVEKGVQHVERSILAPLRKQTFFSLAEANEAIASLLELMNAKPMQQQKLSRKDLFDELEKPVLRALPQEAYVLANWKKATLHIDYHVQLEGHYYSVPYQYVGEAIEIRYTQTTLEVFHKGKRIASHYRTLTPKRGHRQTTLKEHMPDKHKFKGEWTAERFISWAKKTGVYTAQLIEALLKSRKHPEQSFRSCLGVMRLGKSYGDERLELACKRACYLQSHSYKSVESILKNKLDQEALPEPLASQKPAEQGSELKEAVTQKQHQNLRGASYYQKELN
jgi:transposase